MAFILSSRTTQDFRTYLADSHFLLSKFVNSLGPLSMIHKFHQSTNDKFLDSTLDHVDSLVSQLVHELRSLDEIMFHDEISLHHD